MPQGSPMTEKSHPALWKIRPGGVDLPQQAAQLVVAAMILQFPKEIGGFTLW